jgi:hypothetical protein
MSSSGQIDPRWDDPNAYGGGLPPDWDTRRRRAYKRDDWTCRRCGRRSGPYADGDGVRLHAHHKVPRSKGGSNQLSNLTTLCESCHNDSHSHDILASDGWVGDPHQERGLLGRVAARVQQGVRFAIRSIVGLFIYLFSVVVVVSYLLGDTGVADLGGGIPMRGWVGIGTIGLLAVTGAIIWRPKHVVKSTLFGMGILVVMIGLLIPPLVFSPGFLLLEGFVAVPAVVALLIRRIKRSG